MDKPLTDNVSVATYFFLRLIRFAKGPPQPFFKVRSSVMSCQLGAKGSLSIYT